MNYSQTIRSVFGSRANRGPLFSFWTHFPEDDLDADRLAEKTIALQHDLDLDLVKTSPNGMYAVEDYGLQIDFSDVPRGGVAQIVTTPYQDAGDWSRLPAGDLEKGALARELRSLKLIRKALPDVPVVFTLFSPMTLAAKLSQGRIHGQIAERRDLPAIHGALARLAETNRAYAEAAVEAGADGVFFAHQDTGRHLLNYDGFSEFVAPYDVEVLTGATKGRFNILHIHGDHIRFRELQDYPVHALNWHSWETLPTVTGGALTSGRCVVGGVDRRSVTNNDVPAIRQQITAALAAMTPVGDLIIAPSCTIRAGFDPATILAMRDFVRGFAPFSGEKSETRRLAG